MFAQSFIGLLRSSACNLQCSICSISVCLAVMFCLCLLFIWLDHSASHALRHHVTKCHSYKRQVCQVFSKRNVCRGPHLACIGELKTPGKWTAGTLKITQFRKGKSSEPNLHFLGSNPWTFQGVPLPRVFFTKRYTPTKSSWMPSFPKNTFQIDGLNYQLTIK